MEDSMETEREGKNAAITVIRWSARLFGAIFAGFFLFMFIGESMETHTHTGSGPLTPLLAIWLALVVICAVAMLLALKWERPAVLVGVAALFGAHVDGLFSGLFEYPRHLTLKSVVNPAPSVFLGSRPVVLAVLATRRGGSEESGPLREEE